MSVAKGGVVCSLPAHSTIIAAANPAGGHYNRTKSLIENLRMSAPLLSRFDLVFILLDKPNAVCKTLFSCSLYHLVGKYSWIGIEARSSFALYSPAQKEKCLIKISFS